MGGAGSPPCWLFGLRWPNTGAYPGSLVWLMADSRRAYAKEYFPELLLPVSLSSWWDRATPASVGDPPTLAGRSGLVSVGSLLPPLGPDTCPSSVESLFSPVLSKSCNQIPLAFKVWFSQNSSSRCRTPRFGSLMWGSEPSIQWVGFCGVMFSSLWVTHPAVMVFDFIVIAPLLPSHCGSSFVFGCRVSFLVSSNVFLSMVVQQLVVIPVFSQEGVRACPSTLPCWTNLLHFFLDEMIIYTENYPISIVMNLTKKWWPCFLQSLQF